jgi:hypothetical protein
MREGVPFSSMQKAFSAGTMGVGRRRRLVPTRWSITACDSTIASKLLGEIRHYDPIDCFRVQEFSSLNNYYTVLLMPTAWQYEWMEAFLHLMGNEELLFSDHEKNTGKEGLSMWAAATSAARWRFLRQLARDEEAGRGDCSKGGLQGLCA